MAWCFDSTFYPNYSHIAVILPILLESIAIALLLTNIGSLSANFCTYMNFEAENMGLLCRFMYVGWVLLCIWKCTEMISRDTFTVFPTVTQQLLSLIVLAV